MATPGPVSMTVSHEAAGFNNNNDTGFPKPDTFESTLVATRAAMPPDITAKAPLNNSFEPLIAPEQGPKGLPIIDDMLNFYRRLDRSGAGVTLQEMWSGMPEITNGTNGADDLERTASSGDFEELVGFAGSDRLSGVGGPTLLLGGDAHDILVADGGDQVHGGNGADHILVNGGHNNLVAGGDGTDIVFIPENAIVERPVVTDGPAFREVISPNDSLIALIHDDVEHIKPMSELPQSTRERL